MIRINSISFTFTSLDFHGPCNEQCIGCLLYIVLINYFEIIELWKLYFKLLSYISKRNFTKEYICCVDNTNEIGNRCYSKKNFDR